MTQVRRPRARADPIGTAPASRLLASLLSQCRALLSGHSLGHSPREPARLPKRSAGWTTAPGLLHTHSGQDIVCALHMLRPNSWCPSELRLRRAPRVAQHSLGTSRLSTISTAISCLRARVLGFTSQHQACSIPLMARWQCRRHGKDIRSTPHGLRSKKRGGAISWLIRPSISMEMAL